MPITVSGTTITFNNGTTQTTAATGSVSSIATGNGLSGGTITTTGTLTIAAPGYNTVGSYVTASAGDPNNNGNSMSSGSTYAAGSGLNQVCSGGLYLNDGDPQVLERSRNNNLSGTWRIMGASNPNVKGNYLVGAVRVS